MSNSRFSGQGLSADVPPEVVSRACCLVLMWYRTSVAEAPPLYRGVSHLKCICYPKGPKIEKIQSRLKFSISLENFNLACNFQSRRFRIPHKNGRETKEQQLKGKIVSALFHTFWQFSTHFHTFSEFFRIFPPRHSLRIKGVLLLF